MNYEKHEFNIFPEIKKDSQAYEQLKESIQGGYRKEEPLVIFEGKILDGWNRYLICKEIDITATTRIVNFSRIEAIEYIKGSNARRDLTNKEQRTAIYIELHALEMLEVAQNEKKRKISESMQGKQNAKKENNVVLDSVTPFFDDKDKLVGAHNMHQPILKDKKNINNDKSKQSSEKTRKTISKATGLNENDVQKLMTMKNKDPEKFEQVKSGEKNLGDIKKEEKKEKYEAKLKEFETQPSKKNYKYDLFHGSCLDYIPTLEDASIDLLLTDPPYGMDFKSGWVDKFKIQNDKIKDTTILFESVLSSVKSKLKDNAHIYIFGNIYYMEDIKPIIEKYYKLENIIIWDRKIIGMGNLKSYGPSFDIIYFCSNLKWKDLNGVRERDILQFERVSPSNLKHPTEKPLDLLKFLIKKSSKENDTILDPFAGGGSTIIAGIELNRNVKASEIEEQYVLLIRSKTN